MTAPLGSAATIAGDVAIRLVLPYPPPLNHMYGNRGGKRFYKPALIDFRESVAIACRMASCVPIDGPVCVTAHIFRPRKAGDIDAPLKSLLDAMQTFCYANDSQITELHAYRLDDKANPRAVVTVEPCEPTKGSI